MNRFMQKMAASREARLAYWRSIRGASLAIFYAAVFSLFASLGFISLLMQTTELRAVQILLLVLVSGGCAVGYAAAAVRRKYIYFFIIGFTQAGALFLLAWISRDAKSLVDPHSTIQAQLALLGIGATFTLIIGYVLFLAFFSREGTRYFRVQTEVELAAEIHRTLVPVIHKTIGSFEIYGASLPSGQVGGDLVDVAEEGDTWIGYVADVSGHGVSSGVLMAMFKTAVRARGVGDPSSSVLLGKINLTLVPLTMPNMFVTAALLECHKGSQLSASIAGHPPLLHYCKSTRTVNELPSQSLPLGIFPAVTFAADRLTHAPGDVFVLLTDGFTEVFDAKGNELGVEPIKSALRGHADEPLPQLFQQLRQVALRFGRQEDDQTMLLVREIG